MEKEVKKWLIDWFCNHSSLDESEIEALSSDDYFNEGIIDSFAFVELISDINDKYNIAFSNDDFLDPRFSNIDGLAVMINERQAE